MAGMEKLPGQRGHGSMVKNADGEGAPGGKYPKERETPSFRASPYTDIGDRPVMVTPSSDPLQFSRVRLLVEDFDKSWHFYRDVLGLTPVKGHGHPPYGEFVSNNRAVVAIFDRRLMAEAVGLDSGHYPRAHVGRSTLIFEVKDVDTVAKRLRRRGVRLLQGPTDRPLWQLRTIHLRDPDGYLIEIYSRLHHS